ncbi:Nicotinamide riboside transporter pnuC [Sebaldella termitidis]|jgi:nicotinamide mononucleotide transporter|uniref:Nicotinamide mononucleotide transporter PnuC n=1 Tax=Sebaldella termitidis (strain ATCC 33386 / NCTC 11300) TaxID=526218 RepID=D1APE2_SEBTE|nr:nicotinamide riboside transporter PnuC [Sebaldella termitidis]ACZ09976.1 nicotinamide mononucleotide transporter PnuC [Sebaldella termitidis ATCC 33386]SUI25308.1 Nicotinamide riboside transporter pnuC [Sebaldella termitidis]
MKIFKDWNLFEKSWLIIFTLINVAVLIYSKEGILGFTASVTGMLSVILVAKGKISNYYFGIINVVIYGFISYNSKYYGEAMLNILYFLPMQIIGFMMWRRNNVNIDESKEVKAERMTAKEIILWSVLSGIAVIVYGIILKKLNNTLPMADSFTTVLSVTAMILMVKRYIEQWIVWIMIDIVAIYMWLFIKSDYNITIMWIAYLVNAVYGLYNWAKLYRREREVWGKQELS